MQYGKIITKLGYDARFQDFKVQNIVGSTDVKFPIRLEGLAYSHAVFASVSAIYHACDLCLAALVCGHTLCQCAFQGVAPASRCAPVGTAAHCLTVSVQYEPELFPGLIYRMKEPKVVLLIFVSGKVVLTGQQLTRLHAHLPAAELLLKRSLCRSLASVHG